ncbi:MAG: hypothetical protein JWO67_1833, partial [Streptosporangiaceae bacterium]|nr:hypothetical protein [Streptosporangiaceae bacterium]
RPKNAVHPGIRVDVTAGDVAAGYVLNVDVDG